ncbi:MAG: DUF4286 family protein [Bacteroidota bacterium]
MIVYNITSKIDHSVIDDWLQWMQDEHIPDVMATGLFSEPRLCRVIGMDESEGLTYAMQFSCDSLSVMHRYEVNFAKALRKKTQQRYGEKVLSFRTLMEVVG